LVRVQAGENTRNMKEIFFSVSFDPEAYHAFGLKAEGMKPEGGVMGLAIERQPGVIDAGFVETKIATIPAVRAGDGLVSFELLEGPAPKAGSTAARESMDKARNLTLGQDNGGHWVLAWDYTNPGDTDQNGAVALPDLTPIGRHYGECLDNPLQDPLRNVDADHNGEINLGDIAPIGQNYTGRIWAYQVEMGESADGPFNTVGQVLLEDFAQPPGQAIRFEYTFVGQYVENAWYRVVPVIPTVDEGGGSGIAMGTPSDAISQNGRAAAPQVVAQGATLTVTLYAAGLAVPIAHMNGARVVFASSYEYVANSANAGEEGGADDAPDGIWASFATSLIFPPQALIRAYDLGDGKTAVDFNVTTLVRTLDASPWGFGALVNFKLKNKGTDPLVLDFMKESSDHIKRTYYSGADQQEFFFDNTITYTAR